MHVAGEAYVTVTLTLLPTRCSQPSDLLSSVTESILLVARQEQFCYHLFHVRACLLWNFIDTFFYPVVMK